MLKKAKREKAKMRIGLFGAPNSGKTYSALLLAFGLVQDWSKIAVIDTEHGSANLYAHLGEYFVWELTPPFTPERYIEAIKECEKQGIEALIIDSISHEWDGEGGLLEAQKKLEESARNSFTTWGKITPRHNAFINAILNCKMHVIACGRCKVEYVLSENDKGRQVPQKVGTKPITRDGFDYELTTSFELAYNHLATCSKDRTGLFADKPPKVLTQEDGVLLAKWANSGSEPVKAPMDSQTFMSSLHEAGKAKKIGYQKVVQMVSGGNLADIKPEDREQVLADFIEGKFNNENTI